MQVVKGIEKDYQFERLSQNFRAKKTTPLNQSILGGATASS
jgi:hypothetical protein